MVIATFKSCDTIAFGNQGFRNIYRGNWTISELQKSFQLKRQGCISQSEPNAKDGMMG